MTIITAHITTKSCVAALVIDTYLTVHAFVLTFSAQLIRLLSLIFVVSIVDVQI